MADTLQQIHDKLRAILSKYSPPLRFLSSVLRTCPSFIDVDSIGVKIASAIKQRRKLTVYATVALH